MTIMRGTLVGVVCAAALLASAAAGYAAHSQSASGQAPSLALLEPGSAHPLAYYIPQGYHVLALASDQLNPDDDTSVYVALVLASDAEWGTQASAMSRPLLLLHAVGNGRYKLAVRNDKAVPVQGQSGQLRDTVVSGGGLSFVDHMFHLDVVSGGASLEDDAAYTFTYDPGAKDFVLSKMVLTRQWGNNTPQERATYTAADIGRITLSAFDPAELLSQLPSGQ